MSHVRHVLDQLNTTRWPQSRANVPRPDTENFAELAQAQAAQSAERSRKTPVARTVTRSKGQLRDRRSPFPAEEKAKNGPEQNSARNVDVSV